jgi:hypothetical protein
MNELDELRRVIALYGPLLDDGRFDEWKQLFAEDAEWISIPGLYRPHGADSAPKTWTVRGREEIVAQVSKFTAPLRQAGKIRSLHFSGPPVIDIHGDRANAWWDFIIMHITPSAISPSNTGRYYARFEKQGGRWRFTQRVSVQHGAELPDGLTPLPGA